MFDFAALRALSGFPVLVGACILTASQLFITNPVLSPESVGFDNQWAVRT